MTDKTTPEKIALVVLKDQIHNYQQFYAVQPTTGHVDEALVYQEYIRADLVPAQGSEDEPLKAGQYRWVRHKATPGWLDIARVSIEYDGMWMNETSGDAYKADQYVYIGPVIHPPSDSQSN